MYMKRYVVIPMLTAICLLIGLTIGIAARADRGARKDSRATSPRQPKENSQELDSEEGINCVPASDSFKT